MYCSNWLEVQLVLEHGSSLLQLGYCLVHSLCCIICYQPFKDNVGQYIFKSIYSKHQVEMCMDLWKYILVTGNKSSHFCFYGAKGGGWGWNSNEAKLVLDITPWSNHVDAVTKVWKRVLTQNVTCPAEFLQWFDFCSRVQYFSPLCFLSTKVGVWGELNYT